ncbi:MAG: hypothetical protein ACREPC_05695, partial [Stenotrophomonas sp.]
LLLATTPAFAAEPTPVPAQDVVAGGKARVRLYAMRDHMLTVLTNAPCDDEFEGKIVVRQPEEVGTFTSRARAEQLGLVNTSLGIPETKTLRTYMGRDGLAWKPMYTEIVVDAGKPIIVSGNVPHDEIQCEPNPAVRFVPVAGQDYEFQMTTSWGFCSVEGSRVIAQNRTEKAPVFPARMGCMAPDIKTRADWPRHGQDYVAFLFTEGKLQYLRLSDPKAEPVTVDDTPANAPDFAQLLDDLSTTSGAEFCAVVPVDGYRSPLHEQYTAMLARRGTELPNVHSADVTVRRHMLQLYDIPMSMKAVRRYCMQLPVGGSSAAVAAD